MDSPTGYAVRTPDFVRDKIFHVVISVLRGPREKKFPIGWNWRFKAPCVVLHDLRFPPFRWLEGATAFKNRMPKTMKDPDQRGHIHTSWRDDDESNEAYNDFGPELEQLFDRTRTVFEWARFDVACSTYE